MAWTSLHFHRDLARVGAATAGLLDWLGARGAASPSWRAEIELAVTEALTNAIRHGAPSAPDAAETVRLAWRRQGDDLEIEVSEPGHYTPTGPWTELPADPLSEGGRGGFLITRLMDAVEHRNADGRHILVMRRRWPDAATRP